MDWKQVLPPLCRSRIETRFATAGENLPTGSSKFGGRPDVPAGFVWPVFETKTLDNDTVKPRPLAFLAQFDCARLAGLDPEGLLPRTGLLSFFYELGSQRWGYDPKDAGCARVFWFEEGPLAPAEFPQDLEEEHRLPELAAELSAGTDAPDFQDACLALPAGAGVRLSGQPLPAAGLAGHHSEQHDPGVRAGVPGPLSGGQLGERPSGGAGRITRAQRPGLAAVVPAGYSGVRGF